VVSEFSRIRIQMRRLMDDMLYQVSPRYLLDERNWTPQTDVVETPEAFLIITEIPGVKKEDIRITVKKNLVHLSGKRERIPVEKAVRYHLMEMEYGVFERTFELPMTIEDEGIEAQYRDGLLLLTLPKRLAQKKTIPVVSE